MIKFTSNENNSGFLHDYSVEMSISNGVDIHELMEFFSCFTQAVGYSHILMYKACKRYLKEHEFEMGGLAGDVE
tara:strand:+ start:297 stop:518 length:222 start_codon:yes stop_codon:yes gene_type:complete